VSSDRSDASDDLADLTGFSEDDARDPGGMRSELWAGVRQDLTAAAFLWRRRPRHARRLLERATDMLDWLADVDVNR
jgi:hypothetical protein